MDIFGEILGFHLLKKNKLVNSRGDKRMQDIFSLWMLGENPSFAEAGTPYPIWTAIHDTKHDRLKNQEMEDDYKWYVH